MAELSDAANELTGTELWELEEGETSLAPAIVENMYRSLIGDDGRVRMEIVDS